MPKRRVLPATRAELARRRGVSRTAVTLAARTVLAPACLPGGRIDLAAPETQIWLGQGAGAPTAPKLFESENGVTVQQLAQRADVSIDEASRAVEKELAEAVIARGEASIAELAWRAGVSTAEARGAARFELADAVTDNGRVRLADPAVLSWMARHPLGEAEEGLLAAACVGDRIDVSHPAALCFMARALGRVPTARDLAGNSNAR